MLATRLRAIGNKSNLKPGPLDRALARVRLPFDRAYERRALAIDSVAALCAALRTRASAAPQPSQTSPRILVASLRGWSSHNAYELAIAAALQLRGAHVALLTCGGGMPACELGWARSAYPRPCDRCAWLTDRVAELAPLERFALRDLLPWGSDARRAPNAPSKAGVVDPHGAAAISVAWLLKATQLERVPGARDVERDFATAAAGVEHAADAVLERFKPDVVFLLNGLFAAEHVIRAVALARGLRAPTYEIAPRAGALVLSQGTAAPEYDVGELWRAVRDRPLTDRQRAEVTRLLDDRARGVGAHESYYDRSEDDTAELRRRLGLEDGSRLVSLFTNVTWDSATIGHDVGFNSMFDWVEQAVRLMQGRERATLVVRIHPAEARWGTREEVQEVITSRVGDVPANVRFILASEPLSSYALLDISDLLLTYTTTVGLEAAVRGKHVAVAGETHYRGRGFTTDLAGPRDLERLLDGELGPPPAEAAELALRYAHMFFFRAMVPFPPVVARDGHVEAFPQTAEELAPGADPYLDWICDRILDGGDFGLPDALAVAQHSDAA